jgi:translation initiation factor 6 (eIF-6)|tara:strand:- start:302 stop:529 length:228 start_codon:yes stop_codon:yes gene_type:complete
MTKKKEKKMIKTIWDIIEEQSKKNNSAEEVLNGVCNYYRSQGMLITPRFEENTKSKIMEFEAYQEGFLTHHAREL